MNRRDFLKKIAYGTGAAAVAMAMRPIKILAGELDKDNKNASYPDLVAVRNGEPAQLFDKGIEAFGGIGNFVRKGQTVLIKPNMAWAVEPEIAGTTNPALLKRVIEHCLEAGAKSVSVFDHTCDEWQAAYSKSTLERTAKEAGATVAPGHLEGHYQEVSVPGEVLKSAKVHELYLSSDVVINLPVLKHHGGASVTASMKNLMGVVWDRRFYHRSGLDDCIADFCKFKRPTLNIIDAYKVMLSSGPRGTANSQYAHHKMLIISTDIIAADVAAIRTFGAEPSRIKYLAQAVESGLGSLDLNEINIQRISL
jgi:uncharacterized protein (DUF362 family)